MFANLALTLSLVAFTPQVDTQDTRLLSQPALSTNHVAFIYAGDLWVAGRDGQGVRRLTTHAGSESRPRFSPDGEHIAFSAQYDGNVDVYIVPVAGGEPKRLTWHPGPDTVQDFTDDGASVLFSSPRAVYTRRFSQLFTVPIEGGHPQALPIPTAFKAAFSPDGERIAYTPLYEAFRQWKNYRGGTATRIWVYRRSDHSIVQIPQPEERCNDTDPMWIEGLVYFLSDRAGEFNVFSFDPASGAVAQLTHYGDFPVLSASAGAGNIVYEQAGYLHVLNPQSADSNKLSVGVATDLIETRARFVKGNQYIRSASISPTGKRAVFGYRGEVVTVPAKKGNVRNLTHSAGVHDREPVWSPDGRSIAWFTDSSGEYELHVAPHDGKGEARSYELGGAGFYDSLRWAPNSEAVSFSDNSWSLYWLDLESGKVTKVAEEPIYGPVKTLSHSWAPDSKWIAYNLTTPTYIRQVHVYSLEEDKSWPVTDGLSDVGEPVFDGSGDYLYFLASTDAGPVRQWFAMSNADMQMSHSLYVAVLEKGQESPLAPESDEEEPMEDGEEEGEEEAEGEGDDSPEASEGEAEQAEEDEESDGADDEGDEGEAEGSDEEAEDENAVSIDFDGLDHRILALPVPSSFISGLRAGDAGHVYYLRGDSPGSLFAPPGNTTLYRFNLDERKEESIAAGASFFDLSADNKKLLVQAGGSWSIVGAAPGADVGSGKIGTGSIEVKIDPRSEWAQIYDEAWRINRDYFYATNFHGADWPAMREKYKEFLPHIAVRSDLNRIVRWMCSELAVGHHRVGGGDTLVRATNVPVGLLGADFAVDGNRYRVDKVFGGLNWNPNLRSPLTEPGVEVAAGEYLLAVNGVPLFAPENLFSRFENQVGKSVELEVGPSADGSDARTVVVVPIANESALRNRDWVEGNLARVHEATDGRVAYVYVPNTSTAGHTYFKRYFFPQADKQAIIVDERHNGGGQVADYYIDILRRPWISNWTMRYGGDLSTPLSSIQGPKVMLIDETAGSGGDLLPWMFRKLELGPLVGRPTWGGLVGVLGFPTLMDGGSVSAPNLAFWDEDGFGVENVGVPPDVEVEMTPAEVIAGRDPQLEKAIELVLEALEANPPTKLERPPFPVRAR